MLMSKNLGNLIDPNKDLNKIAIICEDQKITYRALDILANSVSYYLLQKGIKKGDRVAIISLNSIDYVIMYLGILKLGAVAVLISVNLPQTEIDYIIKDTDSKLILKDISDIELDTSKEYLFEIEPEKNDPALILYSSGTTGKPKKTIISHRRKSILKTKLPFIKDCTSILAHPLYHSSGENVLELCLASHSTLILLPKFNAKDFIKSIETYKVKKINAVPKIMQLILNEKELIQQTDLSSVKSIYVSSEEFTQNLYDDIIKVFKNCEVHNRYGLTEAGPGIFSKHSTLPTPPLSVGYPNPPIQCRIVNGILQIKNNMILNLESDKLTEDGYYITNDFFKVDEQGFYYFIGRKK
jgi:acyl-CoA synthetase (AMP-forming)/AMP-acid ligase II